MLDVEQFSCSLICVINTTNPNNSNNPKEKIRSALAGNVFGSKNPKPGFKFNPKMIFGGLILLMLVVGGAVGFYLTRVNQDLRQQAFQVYDGQCANPREFGSFICRDGRCMQCISEGNAKSVEDQTRSECPSECRTVVVATPPPATSSCPAGNRDYGDALRCGTACARSCGGPDNKCCPTAAEACPSETIDYGDALNCGTKCSSSCIGSDDQCCPKDTTSSIASCPSGTTSFSNANLCSQNCKTAGGSQSVCTLPKKDGKDFGTEETCCLKIADTSACEDIKNAGEYITINGQCTYCADVGESQSKTGVVNVGDSNYGNCPNSSTSICSANKNEYLIEGDQCIYCDNNGGKTNVPTHDERYENCPGATSTPPTTGIDCSNIIENGGKYHEEGEKCIFCTLNGQKNSIDKDNPNYRYCTNYIPPDGGDINCSNTGEYFEESGICLQCTSLGLKKEVEDKYCSGIGGPPPPTSICSPECDPGDFCINNVCKDGSTYECSLNDPADYCPEGRDACHCTGGDACTGTVCDEDIKDSCERQGRSYCTNWQGSGTTCCVEGYVCHSSGLGCTPGNPTPNPTNPPGGNPTPTPTDRPVGPQCHEITAFNTTGGQSVPLTGNEDDNLIPGQSTLRFICAANSVPLQSRYSYKFRIWESCATSPIEILPDNTPNGIVAPSPNAINYWVNYAGNFAVQCAVCNDITGVCDWEAFTPNTDGCLQEL